MTTGISRRAALMLAVLSPTLLAGRGWAGSVVHDVAMTGLTFDPALLKVAVGDTVRWTNADFVPHTATANDQTWTTGTLKQGETGEMVITAKTSLDYACDFHPHMEGKLLIEG